MGSRRRLLPLVVVLVLVGLAFVYGAVGADGPGGVWLPWVMAGVGWPVATATPTVPAPTMTPTAPATATPTRAPAADVRIGSISGDGEYVIIRNVGTGAQVMTGWWLRSADGQSCEPLVSQTFYFPSGYVLGSGESVRVTSGPGAVDDPPAVLKWTTQNVWANGGDRGDLYDAVGVLRSWFAYGGCD